MQNRRAKIVATLGPATDGLERELVAAGLDAARLNFSHGTPEENGRRCFSIREAAKALNRTVAVIQDLQGPRIRVGKLTTGRPVPLTAGQLLTIVAHDVEGTAERISTTYEGLAANVKTGDPIWLDDGRLRLRVIGVSPDEVVTRVEVGGQLGQHKGMNLPGVTIAVPSLTAADQDHLRFGVTELEVDYVALSFVRTAGDLLEAREMIRSLASDAKIIAKIEKAEAIASLADILNVTDAVMVARGDLGVELGPENVPALQKAIVHQANAHGVPVIVATQMLESMTRDEIPTRAEASDVANAVWDNADAVMLSGETASGRHPRLVLEMMNRIICSAESAQLEQGFQRNRNPATSEKSTRAAVTEAACVLARDLRARAIVGMTQTGLTAQLLSSRRAAAPIFAFSPDERVCRRLALWWGVTPVHEPDSHDLETSIAAMEAYLLTSGAATVGDSVVVAGPHPFSQGTPMNFVKYQQISQGAK